MPDHYKKVYDPEKGKQILIGGDYETIRDEFGNEIERVKRKRPN